MSRAVLTVFVLYLMCLVAGCGSKDKGAGQDGGGDAKAKDVKADGGATDADLTITATELYAAYKADPKAADQRFKGKRLAVSGTVGTRDDEPRSVPKTIMIALKGSSEKYEYVACYFAWESERIFHRLDAKPQPPIIGTCEGAVTSEYGKKGARPMEVRLTKCAIPEVPGAKTPYDRKFAEGHAIGVKHLELYQRANAVAKKDFADQIRRTLKGFSDTYNANAAVAIGPGRMWPSQVDGSKGMMDGYRKAVEPSGIK